MFEAVCPYYMSIGMTYEQFWYGSPSMVKAFREAHELYIEQKNQEMYMQGLYNYTAFRAVIGAFGYGLSGGKGEKPKDYPEYPFAITAHEKEMEKKRSIAHTLEWVAKGQQED